MVEHVSLIGTMSITISEYIFKCLDIVLYTSIKIRKELHTQEVPCNDKEEKKVKKKPKTNTKKQIGRFLSLELTSASQHPTKQNSHLLCQPTPPTEQPISSWSEKLETYLSWEYTQYLNVACDYTNYIKKADAL